MIIMTYLATMYYSFDFDVMICALSSLFLHMHESREYKILLGTQKDDI